MNDTNLSRPHFLNVPAPEKIQHLLKLTESSDPDIPFIGRLVAEMPMLAGMVVLAANSSHYGMHHRIDTPQHAVAMLGPKRVHDLASQITIRDVRENA